MARAMVGDEPLKQWNEETLLQRYCSIPVSLQLLSDLRISTLENAYSKIIASLVNSQQEHLNLADALSVQVVGVLLSLARKNEDHRKKASRGSLWPLCDFSLDHLASAVLPESPGR